MIPAALRLVVLTVACLAVAVPGLADENGPTLRVEMYTGTIPEDEPFRLVASRPDGNYNRLQRGEVPVDGVIRLEGEWLDGEATRVYVRVGRPSVEIGLFDYDPENRNADFSVTAPLSTGDTAPDIAFTGLFDGAPAMLSDFRGEVVLLDFWATWCGPCQEPMAKNQALVTKHDDWEGKVRIVALSIDEEIETAQKHIQDKGWTAFYNAFSSAGTPGWNSDAPRAYGVLAIPTVLLIDGKGEILWRGNPNNADVEKLIEDALAD